MGFKDTVVKLNAFDPKQLEPRIRDAFLPNESIELATKAIRDMVIFTNLRVVFIDVQNITGKRVSFESIPYKHIEAFEVQTAGHLDRDCEVYFYTKCKGKIRIDMSTSFDVMELERMLAGYIC